MGVRGELFSTKVALQNRTYFFNVKENRLGDLYLNIVESKNRDEGGFERQSVILFADDLQEFLQGFDESLKVMEKAAREKRRGGGNSDRDNNRDNDAFQRRASPRQGRDRDRNSNSQDSPPWKKNESRSRFEKSETERPRRFGKRETERRPSGGGSRSSGGVSRSARESGSRYSPPGGRERPSQQRNPAPVKKKRMVVKKR